MIAIKFPLQWVVLDIFPCLTQIIIIADYMLVVTSLPQRPAESGELFIPSPRGKSFKGSHNIRQTMGLILQNDNPMDMVWHYDKRVEIRGMIVGRQSIPYGEYNLPKTVQMHPPGIGIAENTLSVFGTDRNKIRTRCAVIVFC